MTCLLVASYLKPNSYQKIFSHRRPPTTTDDHQFINRWGSVRIFVWCEPPTNNYQFLCEKSVDFFRFRPKMQQLISNNYLSFLFFRFTTFLSYLNIFLFDKLCLYHHLFDAMKYYHYFPCSTLIIIMSLNLRKNILYSLIVGLCDN